MPMKDIHKLSDEQLNNLDYFLSKTSGIHLDKMRIAFGIANGRSNSIIQQNILHSVFTNNIPFQDYLNWLCTYNLEGNNSIFVYEPEDTSLFDKYPLENLYKNLLKRVLPLYNINKDKLKTIELVDVQKITERNQLLVTLAASSQLQCKDKENNTTYLENDIYFAYFILDYSLKHIRLLMHPTTNLVSIAGEEKKKEWDELTWVLLYSFREKVLPFEAANPDWVIDALFFITQDFFHHHNPFIDEKMDKINGNVLNRLLRIIKKGDPTFLNEESLLRFERSLQNMFENELINNYGAIPKQLPFEVFLQESDKGITQFKANSRGKALNYSEAGEIVKLMWNNGDIVSLGITYAENDKNSILRKHPYKVSKTDRYYSLKKTNTSSTKKEVVDDVLRLFSEYKQKVQSSFTDSEDIEQRAYDAESE